MGETTAIAVRHPARYTDSVLDVMFEYVYGRVLDPFAGTGRIHELAERLALGSSGDIETVGVELEPEWADLHPRTIVGNALALPFADASFDCIATSPTYGNRMADHHEARDDSRRITYRHSLGRALRPDNSGQLQWGPKYRAFHERAWAEAARVLKPDSRFVLNASDHIRAGEQQKVVDWHIAVLLDLGFSLYVYEPVRTPRMGFGQNGAARVDHEVVAVMDRTAQSEAEVS